MKKHSITLNLEPKPCSRPRVTRYGTYYSKTYSQFKKDAKALLDDIDIIPLLHRIRARINFIMPIPKSMSQKKKDALNGQYCDCGGDIDNLTKAVYDCLNKIAFLDDKQIVESYCIKRYGYEPRIEIELEEIE